MNSVLNPQTYALPLLYGNYVGINEIAPHSDPNGAVVGGGPMILSTLLCPRRYITAMWRSIAIDQCKNYNRTNPLSP